MKIGSIGYNYSHDKSFRMDMPEGPGAWLFLIVKTPALFEINGEKADVKANSCIILSGDTPCSYSGTDGEYTDDWLFFTAGDDDIALLHTLGIPVNRIIPLGNIEELTQLMHIMTYEHYSAEHLHEEIGQHYLEILFLKLSRMINSGLKLSYDSFSEKNMRLTHIRTRIYTEPRTIGSVDSLAAEAGMSRSGFQHSYKKMFGVSIMSDIVAGRIAFAKRLLTSTPLRVEDISDMCGYSSPYAFMRQFKQKCGRTPTDYRKGK